MSKVVRKKAHWSGRAREVLLFRGPEGKLPFPILGGAEKAQFPYVGNVEDQQAGHSAVKVQANDLVLEINGTIVVGMTSEDIAAVLSTSHSSIQLKTTRPGAVLTQDLRHYLNLRFKKGSPDHEFQQSIRDNLYLRTVPCTTRLPRDEEVAGLDYNFISVEAFASLERSGAFLETGTYDGIPCTLWLFWII
uniref:Uncharacterized protein n=1 Tax=Eptatretus burgeri TaxID=7764 RepID=A0A8C4QIL0_EPTBU